MQSTRNCDHQAGTFFLPFIKMESSAFFKSWLVVVTDNVILSSYRMSSVSLDFPTRSDNEAQTKGEKLPPPPSPLLFTITFVPWPITGTGNHHNLV